MTINEELQKMRRLFIAEHNISCSSCEYWEKNKKGKCASKTYCIVRDNSFNCSYKAKQTVFRKDIRVYFDPTTGKTFTASEYEYALAREAYIEAEKLSKSILEEKRIFLCPAFELKGHKEWVYRFDEDYTEEIKKYESTHNKS